MKRVPVIASVLMLVGFVLLLVRVMGPVPELRVPATVVLTIATVFAVVALVRTIREAWRLRSDPVRPPWRG